MGRGHPGSRAATKVPRREIPRPSRLDTVIVAGLMTHLAVDSTARDATVLGYGVMVAADACATGDLPNPEGGIIPAQQLQAAALAGLADRFA